MLKAYRVHKTDNGYIGKFERLLGEKTPADLKKKEEPIEIKSNKVYDGCLYVPSKNQLVDEYERKLINKKIDNLTYEEKDGCRIMKSLGDLSKEEQDLYWQLQDDYDYYFNTHAPLVEIGKEEEYREKIRSLRG